ncbi:hypothetical protein ABZP36_011184 [Zizania latifolia]
MDENIGKQHGVDVGEQMALDEQHTEREHLCKQHGMEMDGNTILLLERVLNLLDELANGKRKVAETDDSNDVLFVVNSMSSGTEVPDSQEENKQDYSEQNAQATNDSS